MVPPKIGVVQAQWLSSNARDAPHTAFPGTLPPPGPVVSERLPFGAAGDLRGPRRPVLQPTSPVLSFAINYSN